MKKVLGYIILCIIGLAIFIAHLCVTNSLAVTGGIFALSISVAALVIFAIKLIFEEE